MLSLGVSPPLSDFTNSCPADLPIPILLSAPEPDKAFKAPWPIAILLSTVSLFSKTWFPIPILLFPAPAESSPKLGLDASVTI